MNYAEAIQRNLNSNRPYSEGLDFIEAISIDSYVSDPIKQISRKSRIGQSSVGQDFTLSDNSKVQFSLAYDNVTVGKE
jgi:hypothetical protein